GQREHRIPLSARALAILKEMQTVRHASDSDGFVFPGGKLGKPLSNMAMTELLRRMNNADITVHGFRSSFRDCAAAGTNFPCEGGEMALAHVVSSKVEAAYRRSDLFDKRRRLMGAWGTFCTALEQRAKSNLAPLPKQALRSTDRPRPE